MMKTERMLLLLFWLCLSSAALALPVVEDHWHSSRTVTAIEPQQLVMSLESFGALLRSSGNPFAGECKGVTWDEKYAMVFIEDLVHSTLETHIEVAAPGTMNKVFLDIIKELRVNSDGKICVEAGDNLMILNKVYDEAKAVQRAFGVRRNPEPITFANNSQKLTTIECSSWPATSPQSAHIQRCKSLYPSGGLVNRRDIYGKGPFATANNGACISSDPNRKLLRSCGATAGTFTYWNFVGMQCYEFRQCFFGLQCVQRFGTSTQCTYNDITACLCGLVHDPVVISNAYTQYVCGGANISPFCDLDNCYVGFTNYWLLEHHHFNNLRTTIPMAYVSREYGWEAHCGAVGY